MSRVFKAARIINDEEKYQVEVAPRLIPEPAQDENGMTHDAREAEVAVQNADNVLKKAFEDAERHLEKTSREAEKIIGDASREAERIKKAAYDEGFSAGKEDGYNNGLADTSEIKKEAEKYLAESRHDYENALEKAEKTVVELITSISKKLIGDIADIRPDIIVCLIKRGLTDATVGGTVVIHVSADDYSAAIENRDLIQSFIEGSSTIEIMKDLSLRQSDCIIETPYGNIDCSLDRQFSQLRENLYLIYNNRNAAK